MELHLLPSGLSCGCLVGLPAPKQLMFGWLSWWGDLRVAEAEVEVLKDTQCRGPTLWLVARVPSSMPVARGAGAERGVQERKAREKLKSISRSS